MKLSFHIVTLLAAALHVQAHAAEREDALCAPLRAFVDSVAPGETRALAFNTRWGADFKDSADENVMSAKRCAHGGYAPAKAVCASLMEHGAVEFSQSNAERALTCLSSGTRFASQVTMTRGAFSFNHGTDERGSSVKLIFDEDQQLGGMVLRITAEGY